MNSSALIDLASSKKYNLTNKPRPPPPPPSLLATNKTTSINLSLRQVLEEVQLESFWPVLRDQLQITQLSHFDYVEIKDLEKIGLSLPAIRRLLSAVNKYKNETDKNQEDMFKSRSMTLSPQSYSKLSAYKANTKPIVDSPPVTHDKPTNSKLYSSNISKNVLTNKLLTLNNIKKSKKNESSSLSSTSSSGSSTQSNKSVSFLIKPSDIQFMNGRNGGDVLGHGHFGVVRRAVWTTHTGAKINVAIKCLHNDCNSSNEENLSFIDLVNEISCMCGLEHKNLIKLFGIVLNSNIKNENSIIMMVTELAPYGSLYSYLRKFKDENRMINVSQLYSYIYQVSCGMEYLESKNLVHRDLAARNLLLYTIDVIKICDFGLTRSLNKNGLYTQKESHKIPAAWYPPESIRDKIFSTKCDVWMFGVCVWEIFTLCEHPWPNMSSAEILKKIYNENQRLPIPYTCSRTFYSLLLQCWSNDPVERPAFSILKKLIKLTKIVEMKAKKSYKNEGKLEIEISDMITIIDGAADRYWWKGQNNRTLLIGNFPRAILDPQRPITGQDISMPLKNSFIHCGHMGVGPNEKTWGKPGKIDEIFLSNPLNPPDLLECIDVDNLNVNVTGENSNNHSECQTDNLIDLLDTSNEIRVTYPDYTGSFDSSSLSIQSTQSSTHNTKNLPLVNIDFSGNTQSYNEESKANLNTRLSEFVSTNNRSDFNSIKIQNLELNSVLNGHQSKDHDFKTSSTSFKPTNPFFNEQSKPIDINNVNSNINSKTMFNFSNNNTNQFSKTTKSININATNDINKLNVDDLLNKNMNDLINDLKSVKLNSN